MKYKLTNAILIIATATLAALGCWFLWCFPMEWMWGENQHCLFERQVAWNAIGMVFFLGAWVLGWKRWLKAAPWLMVAWIGLLFMALMGRPINGVYRWVAIGPVRLNVQTVLWPVSALFAGWLCSRPRIKPWMVFAVFGCGIALMTFKILSNPNRVERIMAFVREFDPADAKMYMQCQMRTALEAANWFGCSGRSLRLLPCAHTDSVVAGTALMLGKWLPACAIALMTMIGACLARFRQGTADPAKRMYILLFGVVLVGTALWSYLQCFMLVPVFGCTFSLLGYGGTDVLFTWLGLGITLSAGREENCEQDGKAGSLLVWTIAFVLSGVLISAFVWAPKPNGRTFGEPPQRMPDLGLYGVQPVRGSILAADGAVLAESVPEWHGHIDPKAVRYGAGWTTNDVVEYVSKGLGLPVDDVRKIYENQRKRYVPLPSPIDGEALLWCQHKGRAKRCGLILERIQRRCYPLGAAAAYVTGCCNMAGDYSNPMHGASGLEYSCESILVGKNGMIAAGLPPEENERIGKPVGGGTIRTTIRCGLQKATARILADAVASNHAETAWAIAVKVPGGEIVAMASCPAYDPNIRGAYGSSRFVNGAVQISHEPGALMKPLLYAMAVDAGAIRSEDVADFSKTTFTNLCHAVGTNVLWQGMKKFRIAGKLGEGKLYAEESGMVQEPHRWSPVARLGFGIGQGLTMTGVQLAQAYATLANRGVRVTPYLVESMVDVSGEVVWKHEANPSERFVSVDAALAVRQLLLGQTNSVANVEGASVAGKASTFALVREHREYESAEYSSVDFDALYAGFFPAEKPQYAVVVGFRKPQPEHASEKVALPTFERIAACLMNEHSVAE